MIKRILMLLLTFGFFQTVLAQNMTNKKIEEILTKVTDTVSGYPGYWEVIYKERELLCLTDEGHNRMRIITPIVEQSTLEKELLLDVLTANFHAALDVKYALSQGYLWSVYIHPLKELSEYELESAIDQVVNATNNFGTTFSSTDMVFGGGNNKAVKKEDVGKKSIEKPVLQQL